jgi:ABC-type branched-subunit amino acid transport system ATPase component
LCDRACVLEQGHAAKTGTGAELLGNPRVKSTYLGIQPAEDLQQGSQS